MLKKLPGRLAHFRVVLQATLHKVVPFLGQAVRNFGRFTHADFEHDLKVGIKLVPRALKD